MTAAAVPMSIYNTLAQDQVSFIAGESRPVVVVLEDHDRYQRWERALEEVDSIRHLVMLADADRVDDPRVMTWSDLLPAATTPAASRSGWSGSPPTCRRRSSTPPAPPATPRAWCSPTTT